MRLATLSLASLLAGPALGDDPKFVELTGRTEAVARVEVRPRASGLLTRVAAADGDRVKAGDLLAEVDPRPYRAALDAARAKMDVAETQLKTAEANRGRTDRLVQQKVTSRDELDQAAAGVVEAKARVEAARADVALAEINLSYTRLTSPITGQLGRFAVSEGNLLLADRTALVVVTSVDPVRIGFDLDERTLLRLLRAGPPAGRMPVEVGFPDEAGFPHKGHVDFVDREVDPRTATCRARAVLANPDGLFVPGLSARVRLPLPAAK